MAVTNWCNNVNTPRNDKIDKICEILRVSRTEITEEQSTVPNLSVPAAYPVPIIGVPRGWCTPVYSGVQKCTFFKVYDGVSRYRKHKKWHHYGHHLLS